MAMWKVMSISNTKVNTFAPIPHTLLCVSSIMSMAINNPPASATSNAECFSNIDFLLIDLKRMAKKHIYYYKGMCYDPDSLLPLFPRLSFLWLISLTTVYFYPTLIFPLTHISHDCVLLSHAYLSSDSYLSWPCTFIPRLSFLWLISLTTVYFLSHLLHYDSHLSLYQKRIYRPRYSL